jgi:hypothetical protein
LGLSARLEASELENFNLRLKLNKATSGGLTCNCVNTALKASTYIGPEEIVEDSEEEREKIRLKLTSKRRPIKREATIVAGNLMSTRLNSEYLSDEPAGPVGNTSRELLRQETIIVDESDYKVDVYRAACADLSKLFKDTAPLVSNSSSSGSVGAIRTPSPTASQFIPALESPSASQFVFMAVPDNSEVA